MSFSTQLQTKANFYKPGVRLSETELIVFDSDPSVLNAIIATGFPTYLTSPEYAALAFDEQALCNATTGAIFSTSTGSLYVKTDAGWIPVGTGASSGNYAIVYDVEVLEPIDGTLTIIREADGITVSKVITEATKLKFHLVWDRPTGENLDHVSTLPAIDGAPITSNLDGSSTFEERFAKTQKGTFEYVIPGPGENNVAVTLGEDAYAFIVEQVVKPVVTYTVTLPMLPWDPATEQSYFKDGDLLTITITGTDQDLNAIRVNGGDLTTEAFGLTQTNNGITFLTTDVSLDVLFAADATSVGAKNISIQARSSYSGAWSDPVVIQKDADPRTPAHTLVYTYPANQLSVKDIESVVIGATVNYYDEILFTPGYGGFIGADPTQQFDNVPANFVSDDVAKTWNYDPVTLILNAGYKYIDVKMGDVRYRSYNGTEVTLPVTFKVSNTIPTITSQTLALARKGETVTSVVTFDQPVFNFDAPVLENAAAITSVVENTENFTITLTIDRDPTTVPALVDTTFANVSGPSNIPAVSDIIVSDNVLFNGFIQETVTIPPGLRTGNIPIQVDLTNFQAAWTISWDGTEANTVLTPVFDAGLAGSVTADKQILLTQAANGTLDFEILYSDTTIIQTTMRIQQTAQ